MNRKEFEDKYFIQLLEDSPIEIYGLKLFPVKMRNAPIFNILSSVLQIKKDRIPDAKIISMSYLEYLIHLILESKEDDTVAHSLISLFKICTMDEKLKLYICSEEGQKPYIKINNTPIKSAEFKIIKDIILYQNITDYDGVELNEDLEKALADAKRIRSNGFKRCGLEKQIISATIGTSYRVEDLLNMSIRKFDLLLEMKDKEVDYKILMTAKYSGMVEFKEEIPHYLSEKEVNKYEASVMDYGSFKNKFGNVSKTKQEE